MEFAKVKNSLNNEKKTLKSLYKELKQTITGLELIIKSGNMDYTLIFCHQNYILKLKINIKNQHKLIEKIEKELKEKNQIMLNALKEKTMMEKLKEKALGEFKKNAEKLDLLQIDEIAVNRYKRAG